MDVDDKDSRQQKDQVPQRMIRILVISKDRVPQRITFLRTHSWKSWTHCFRMVKALSLSNEAHIQIPLQG